MVLVNWELRWANTSWFICFKIGVYKLDYTMNLRAKVGWKKIAAITELEYSEFPVWTNPFNVVLDVVGD